MDKHILLHHLSGLIDLLDSKNFKSVMEHILKDDPAFYRSHVLPLVHSRDFEILRMKPWMLNSYDQLIDWYRNVHVGRFGLRLRQRTDKWAPPLPGMMDRMSRFMVIGEALPTGFDFNTMEGLESFILLGTGGNYDVSDLLISKMMSNLDYLLLGEGLDKVTALESLCAGTHFNSLTKLVLNSTSVLEDNLGAVMRNSGAFDNLTSLTFQGGGFDDRQLSVLTQNLRHPLNVLSIRSPHITSKSLDTLIDLVDKHPIKDLKLYDTCMVEKDFEYLCEHAQDIVIETKWNPK